MLNLLSNSCICNVFIQEDDPDKAEIRFFAGEMYRGAVKDGIPFGEGELILRDGSRFEGNFDINGIKEGKFFHFSMLCFEGTFSKDRFLKGKIRFSDGRYFEGEWGTVKGKWELLPNNGTLRENDDAHIDSFNKDAPDKKTLENGMFTIHKKHSQFGFCIAINRWSGFDCKEYSNIFVDSECQSYYEMKKEGTPTVQKVHNQLSRHFPIEVFEWQDQGLNRSYMVIVCLGLKIEFKEGSPCSFITTTFMEGLHIEGVCKIKSHKFKVKGRLMTADGQVKRDIEIVKEPLGTIVIKFEGSTFYDYKEFIEYLHKYLKSLHCESVRLKEHPITRRSSTRLEAFENIVKEIIREYKSIETPVGESIN